MPLQNSALKKLVNNVIETNESIINLKVDVKILKEDVNVLKADVKILKQGQTRSGVLQEHMDTKLDTIIEIITGPIKKTEEIQAIKMQLQEHDSRICAIECGQKEPIR